MDIQLSPDGIPIISFPANELMPDLPPVGFTAAVDQLTAAALARIEGDDSAE